MDFFQGKGVAFVSVTETFDTSTPMGRMVLNLLATFAQFERETTAQRTRDKVLASRRRGLWTGGRPMLGYDVVDKKLVIKEGEAEQVRAIFQLYLDHGSLLRVLDELRHRGWRTKEWIGKDGKSKGGQPFSKSSLSTLLKHPVYVGKVRAGDEVVDGVHDAIVATETWERVQSLLRANAVIGTRSKAPRGRRSSALLAGIARCRCGAAMTHHYTKKGARRYSYYVCRRQQKEGSAACPRSHVAAGKLESFIVDQLRTIGRDPKLLEATLEADQKARYESKPELTAQAPRLRAEKGCIERERRNVVEAIAAGGQGADTLTKKLVELEQDHAGVSARLEAVVGDLATLETAAIDPDELRVALADLEPIWAELFPKERARLLDLLLERVEFDAAVGEVEITFRPGGPRAVGRSRAGAAS